MHTERPDHPSGTSSSFDWPPPDPMTAQLTRRPPTVGRRTHLIGVGAAALVVVLGIGAAVAFGSSDPGSPTLAGASSSSPTATPTGASTGSSTGSSAPVPSSTDTPHPTTSTFDSAVPDATPVPSLPTVNVLIPVGALKQGNCIRDALKEQKVVKDVFVVPCAKPHAVEVYAAYDLTGSSFPGTSSVRRQALSGCETRFTAFNGRSARRSYLDLSDLYPTAESWSINDKSVLCLVAEPNEKTRTGSLRGSGR